MNLTPVVRFISIIVPQYDFPKLLLKWYLHPRDYPQTKKVKTQCKKSLIWNSFCCCQFFDKASFFSCKFHVTSLIKLIFLQESQPTCNPFCDLSSDEVCVKMTYFLSDGTFINATSFCGKGLNHRSKSVISAAP